MRTGGRCRLTEESMRTGGEVLPDRREYEKKGKVLDAA